MLFINSFDLNNNLENNTRGFHANENFEELMIVQNGSVKLTLINQQQEKIIKILNKNDIYLIPRNHWLTYTILDSNSIVLVLVNEILSKSISIHDFEEFIKNESLN